MLPRIAAALEFGVPVFYFDVDGGVEPYPDDEGCDLPGPAHAHEAAIQLVSEMAWSHFRNTPESLTAVVRDEAGELVSTVTLCLLATPPPEQASPRG
jgi:hypothetical protein